MKSLINVLTQLNLDFDCVIEVEDWHIEWHWSLIIHIEISQYPFVKFGMILIT